MSTRSFLAVALGCLGFATAALIAAAALDAPALAAVGSGAILAALGARTSWEWRGRGGQLALVVAVVVAVIAVAAALAVSV